MKQSISFIDTGEKLIITNNSYKDFRSIIFFGFGSLLVLSPLIFRHEILNAKTTPLFISMLHIGLGIFCYRRFLWKLKGKEILTLTDTSFSFQRKGSFLIPEKNYLTSDFLSVVKVEVNKKNLHIVNKIKESNQRLIYLNGKGKVFFKFKTGTENWFNNVTESEINIILEQIQKKIQNNVF